MVTPGGPAHAGRCRRTSSSSDSRPSLASSSTLIAVNGLVTEATWNTDAGVIGTPCSRLAVP